MTMMELRPIFRPTVIDGTSQSAAFWMHAFEGRTLVVSKSSASGKSETLVESKDYTIQGNSITIRDPDKWDRLIASYRACYPRNVGPWLAHKPVAEKPRRTVLVEALARVYP